MMEPLNTRVPPEVRKQFEARASELNKTPAALIRELVIDFVMTEDDSDDNPELREVRRELRVLRNTLITSVAGLLMKAGKLKQHEAEDWVTENLLE